MLKSLMFVFISAMTFSAFAQNSQYDDCMDKLEYYYLASHSEATTVCRQNSSPGFMYCMVRTAQETNMHVLDAAPRCSATRVRIPIESKDPSYTNFKSCPSKLQARAHMSYERANQVCDWDHTDITQNCILDLTEKAGFHPEHSVQYCAFANSEYRNKVPKFVKCAIENSRIGHDVYTTVMICDEQMVYGNRRRPSPRYDEQPRYDQPAPRYDEQPRYEPNYNSQYPNTPPNSQQVQPDDQQDQTEIKPETKTSKTKPAPKKADRKVPTPVAIKIEGSSNPEVNDQPINTGTTDNSESLPLD